MKILSCLLAFILLISVSSCSTISDTDLADLQSPNDIVKQEAIQRIPKEPRFPLNLVSRFFGSNETEKAVAIMVGLLREGKETKDTERLIVRTLGQLSRRTEVSMGPLIQMLEDKDPRMRGEVLEALGRSKSKQAVTALLKMLDEEMPNYCLIWAIGEIGDQRAVPYLNRLLMSEDEYVRYNAYQALAKIGEEQGEVKSDKTNSDTRSLLDVGRAAFKKYQDAMMAVFQKIAGVKRA
jgi:HEAT repeat protein